MHASGCIQLLLHQILRTHLLMCSIPICMALYMIMCVGFVGGGGRSVEVPAASG